MKESQLFKVLIAVVICLFLGFLSGYSTVTSVESWYGTINKPSFNPPNWIFGPVWSVLYVFIGIVFGRSWHKSDHRGLTLMAAQFFINLIWSPIFFGLQQPGFALIVIVILVLLIAACIRHYLISDRPSAFLLIPYMMWVSFATVLNGAIFYLN